MSELEELLSTMEMLRAKYYPNLPAELVRDIIEVQQTYLEDEVEARRQIQALVERYILEGDWH